MSKTAETCSEAENFILSVMLMLTLLDSSEDLSCAGAKSPVSIPAVPHLQSNLFGRCCLKPSLHPTLQRPAGQTSELFFSTEEQDDY